MNSIERRLLMREYLRRFGPKHRPTHVAPWVGRVRMRKFDKQQAFSADPAKKKAAVCTRRAGKTTGCASDLLESAGENPGTEQLYVTLTRERAKDLMWEPLKRIIHEENIETAGKPNETELRIRLPNGSSIKLAGADKAKEIEKRRGSKYKRVRIDESQAFGSYLQAFIEDVIEPATMDDDGDIGLLGTPGVVCAGYFHDVSTGKIPGWNVHRWSVFDNPHMPHARKWVADVKKARGWDDSNPTYRREWLGEWVADTGALFYSFDAGRNSYRAGQVVPYGRGWTHVLGWDLGKTDAMALVWYGFHPDQRDLYEVFSWKKSGITSDEVIREARAVEERLGLNVMARVADTGGLGALLVEEVGRRTGMWFEAAKKTSKGAHVALFNDDLLTARVKLLEGSPYAEEMAVLPRDGDWLLAEHDNKPAPEDPRFANHCCDAGLYAWRWAYHYLHEAKPEEPPEGTPEAADIEAERIEQRMIELEDESEEDHWMSRELEDVA